MGLYENMPWTNFHELNLAWVIQQVKKAVTAYEKMEKDFSSLEEYVKDYFKNLDVDDAISEKIDQMAASGELGEIIARYVNENQAIINVARMVDGPLTDDNIVEAINKALEKSSYIYIPAGVYHINMEIEYQNLSIYFDDDCWIRTEIQKPAFYFRNCSVHITGGIFSAGERDEERKYVGYPEPAEFVGARSILLFKNCHNTIIDKIDCTFSKMWQVIYAENCTNFEVVNCNFSDVLNSAIFFSEHCEKVAVRNCRFYNSRYALNPDATPRYYCYFVYTGVSSFDIDFVPIDGLIYENNMCIQSEDCGLDTHGAKNVIIRNNTVNDTVCAITAYNDTLRVVRPAGWRMENIIIENNYCKSTRRNNPNTGYPHPFIFLGSPNDHSRWDSGWENNPGKYDDFINCVVRNNTFITENEQPYVIRLGRVSQNVIFENNYIDAAQDNNNYAVGGQKMINAIFRGNTFKRGQKIVVGYNSIVHVDNMCSIMINNNYLQYIKYPNGRYYELRGGTVVSGGETYPASQNNYYNISQTYGMRCNDAYIGSTTRQITVRDGIAVCNKHDLLPGLSVRLKTTDGQTTIGNFYIRNLIDMDNFQIVDGSGDKPVDGSYMLEMRPAVAYRQDKMMVMGQIKVDETSTPAPVSVNVHSEPSTASPSIAAIPYGSYVITFGTRLMDSDNEYREIICLYNGAFVHGYVWNQYLVDYASDPV